MIREKANPGIYDHYPMEVGQISALRLNNRQVRTFDRNFSMFNWFDIIHHYNRPRNWDVAFRREATSTDLFVRMYLFP